MRGRGGGERFTFSQGRDTLRQERKGQQGLKTWFPFLHSLFLLISFYVDDELPLTLIPNHRAGDL